MSMDPLLRAHLHVSTLVLVEKKITGASEKNEHMKAEKKSASEDWRTYIYNSVNAFQEYKKNDGSLIIGFNTLQKSNSDLLIRLLHKS